jgi:hypothetical protein
VPTPPAPRPALLRPTSAGVALELLVQPRASRTRLVGALDGRVKIALAAPPVDGAANEALLAFVAGLFGRPRQAVTLLRGEASRRKTVQVAGVTVESARLTLEGRLP